MTSDHLNLADETAGMTDHEALAHALALAPDADSERRRQSSLAAIRPRIADRGIQRAQSIADDFGVTALADGSYAKIQPNGLTADAQSFAAQWDGGDDDTWRLTVAEQAARGQHPAAVGRFTQTVQAGRLDQARRSRSRLASPRPRGAGRPRVRRRAVCARPSARSGDSGDSASGGSSEPAPRRRTVYLYGFGLNHPEVRP